MFTQSITSIEIELANKCNAKCPQCPRYDTSLKLIPGLNKDEITLDVFKNIDCIGQIQHIDFCGATGDPIVAKDLLPIVNYIKKINPTCRITISTNGSLHEEEFWQSLVGTEITFCIDGLEDTHSMYRIGTSFHKVLNNAKAFIEAGGKAVWQMILFKHNEHQINACRKIAEDLGFEKFETMYSDRFSYVDHTDVNSKRSIYTLNPAKKIYNSTETKTKDRHATKSVSCMSLNRNHVFIYADGTVWPCCYLGGITTWGKTAHTQIETSMIKKHIAPTKSISTHKLTDIIATKEWHSWEWVTNGYLPTCREYCGVL
jgi:MoaA/NifB/PqqE/SkfB family radical SAM enzyme